MSYSVSFSTSSARIILSWQASPESFECIDLLSFLTAWGESRTLFSPESSGNGDIGRYFYVVIYICHFLLVPRCDVLQGFYFQLFYPWAHGLYQIYERLSRIHLLKSRSCRHTLSVVALFPLFSEFFLFPSKAFPNKILSLSIKMNTMNLKDILTFFPRL